MHIIDGRTDRWTLKSIGPIKTLAPKSTPNLKWICIIFLYKLYICKISEDCGTALGLKPLSREKVRMDTALEYNGKDGVWYEIYYLRL